MLITTDVMKDASEIIHYTLPDLPMYLKRNLLSDYPGMRALCHWHDDLEFIRIMAGEMNYYINGKNIPLREGDCLMINSRQMHYGHSRGHRECDFICLVFPPRLLSSSASLYEKYVAPVLADPALESLLIPGGEKPANDIASLTDQMLSICQKGNTGFELELLSNLSLLWSGMLKNPDLFPRKESCRLSDDLTVQKDMVSYIYRHYAEKITLSDIAAAGNVSRNKCCMIFKRYLQQTPIDFLNNYRLKVSCHLLRHTSSSVSEIAFACGFNHLSYYSRLFCTKYGDTPSRYRKLP